LAGPSSNTPTGTTPGVSAIDFAINQIETDCSVQSVTDVTVFASVIDQNGDPITGLTTSNFSLSESSGINSAPILPGDFEVDFVEQLQIPASVALAMDYSTSMLLSNAINQGSGGLLNDAVINFVNQLKPNDRGAIIKFAQLVDETQLFTDDKAALINAINALPWAQNWYTESALYDALEKAIEHTALESNRKAVVAITDGKDNNSSIGIDDLIAYALSENVPLFIIGFINSFDNSIEIDSLKQIVEETGGHFYEAASVDDIFSIYQQISDIFIYDQYVITYESLFHGNVDVTLDIEAEVNGLTDSDFKQFTSCP
jgi:Ca-activated chloride channel family protein